MWADLTLITVWRQDHVLYCTVLYEGRTWWKDMRCDWLLCAAVQEIRTWSIPGLVIRTWCRFDLGAWRGREAHEMRVSLAAAGLSLCWRTSRAKTPSLPGLAGRQKARRTASDGGSLARLPSRQYCEAVDNPPRASTLHGDVIQYGGSGVDSPVTWRIMEVDVSRSPSTAWRCGPTRSQSFEEGGDPESTSLERKEEAAKLRSDPSEAPTGGPGANQFRLGRIASHHFWALSLPP
ncbi:hypothetical protein BJ875DRAFT_538595 [Amylocarpus encephaloides]|uniref:Uncharacterized protein n=1 Tax=Amylocarpus encephaloides TaxID=45428 RepID=A0A9P8CA76_9HELO|nr:hypothetical protein BJ875DRAFT_538595 [Amylocarpus encephaloides]